MELIKVKQAEEWNKIVQDLPGAHILQTWEWGQVKCQYGWQASAIVWRDPESKTVLAAALTLMRSVSIRKLPTPLKLLYIPKGPLMDWANLPLVNRVLDDIEAMAKDRSAIFIKIDPDVIIGWGIPREPDSAEHLKGIEIEQLLVKRHWQFSDEQVQFKNTVMIDLDMGEEELLARMKQKTRYNIRLAERKGVRTRFGNLDDLPILNDMYARTSVRDGFVIRSPEYYLLLWKTFMQSGQAKPLIAEVDGVPVAAVFIFHFAGVARYLYGMSEDQSREKMPNYLLQWEAMRYAKQLGCHSYDMWGAPDIFDETDSLWGVFRFKEGFNGTIIRTIGAWDFPSKPFYFKLYSYWLPKVLNLMRSRGRKITKKRMIS